MVYVCLRAYVPRETRFFQVHVFWSHGPPFSLLNRRVSRSLTTDLTRVTAPLLPVRTAHVRAHVRTRTRTRTDETSAEWTYRSMGTAGEEPYGPEYVHN